MTASPVLTQTPICKDIQVSTANTNRDGATGTYSAAYTVGANGALIDYIAFQAQVTSAAGLLRIFVSTDGGATFNLYKEVATVGATVSGTVGGERQVWIPDGGIPWAVPGNAQIKFNVNNAETWNAWICGGSF